MAGFDLHQRPGELAVHAFSVDEYYRLGDLGILGERTELIEGVVYDMAPQGPIHSSIVTRIDYMLKEAVGRGLMVIVQMPIAIPPRSEPMPDIAVLTWRDDFYRSGLPEPKDVKLLIEVSDSTIAHDRAKAGLYAAGGVREYWLIDVSARRLLVHRDPQDGRYTSVEHRVAGEQIEPGFGGRFEVSDFL